MSITINEAIAQITSIKREKITLEQMGNALETSKQYIGQIRTKELKEFQIEKIEKFFDVKLTDNTLQKSMNKLIYIDDKAEIPYWPELPEEFKNPKIRSVWFDKEIIENAWFLNADSLVIVPMIGDYLKEYWYKINDRDLLIIDTNQKDISENGIFFATSQGGQKFWVREMEEFVNGDVEFRRYMTGEREIKKYSREDLKAVDFKVIGRVVKNVSFKL